MAYKNKADMYQYNNDFNSRNYDRINFTVPKGARECLKRIAEYRGMSVNALLREAVGRTIGIDLNSKGEIQMLDDFKVCVVFEDKAYAFDAKQITRNTTDGDGNPILSVKANCSDGTQVVMNLTTDWKIKSIIRH